MAENGNRSNRTLAGNRHKMDAFLEALAASGNVYVACKRSGVPRRTAYDWRKRWKTFADEWQDALDDALDKLEGEAWKRAKVQSDRLIMFLLKAHRPELYSDRVKMEHSGEGGGAIVVKLGGVDLDKDL